MNEDFITLLEEFEKEKGISRDVLIEALEQALVSAYKRNYGNHKNVRVEIDRQNGSMRVFVKKEVVDEVVIPDSEISLETDSTFLEELQRGLLLALLEQGQLTAMEYRHAEEKLKRQGQEIRIKSQRKGGSE